MFSIYITKKSIVLQPSQQALLQQDCRATFSGPSPSRKQSQASRVHPFHFSLFYTQSINNDTNYTKDELQLAQFLCFIPTYFQEMYRVTVTTTEIIQHKPTYHSSGRRFSGSGFSGSFLIFLVLVLLVIDGFDDSGFAGFSFLVLLVLALLVLGGGFSGSSFLALLVLLPKAIAIFEDNDTIFRFLSFLSLFLYSINQPPTMQIIQRKKMPTTATFLFDTTTA